MSLDDLSPIANPTMTMGDDPSFSALFRRSRYSRTEPCEDGNDEQKQQRTELFAVAAVAFVMKYEPVFKNHFLRRICGVEVSDPVCLNDYEILIQPHDFDLVLLNTKRTEAVVVEFKVHAPLKDYQNFKKKERFFDSNVRPKGYGGQIEHVYSKSALKYVVLLKGEDRKSLGLDKDPVWVGRIQCHSRVWHDVAIDTDGQPKLALVDDLLSWLAEQRVYELNDRIYTKMKMINSTEDAAKMFGILSGVLALARPEFDARNNEGGSYFGVNIPKKINGFEETKKHTNADPLGWLGYECAKNDKSRTSLWIYGVTGSKREQFFALIRKIIGDENAVEKKDDAVVVFPHDQEKIEGEMEWFRSVFEKLKQL